MAKRDVRFNEFIIIRYCQEYLPADKVSEDVIYKTSQQIQDELSEMADISLNDIAEKMVELGYEMAINPEGKPAWLMQRK